MQLRQPYLQYPAYGSQAKQPHHKRKGKKKEYGKQRSVEMPTQELMPATEVAHKPASQQDEVVCFKCYQKGHIVKGCRVRLDHLKADVNSNRPNPGDKGLVAPK
jgi:hypothetical protein